MKYITLEIFKTIVFVFIGLPMLLCFTLYNCIRISQARRQGKTYYWKSDTIKNYE